MRNTGCLIFLLVVTILVAVIAAGAALFALNWARSGEEISVGLPLPTLAMTQSKIADATPAATPTATIAPTRPTATFAPPTPTERALFVTGQPPAPTAQPPALTTQSPAPTAQPTGGAAEPAGDIILDDPTVAELTSRLSHLQAGQAIRITMNEDALEKELLAALGGNLSAGFQFQSLNMKPGRLIIAGKAQMDALVVPLEVTLRPYVVGCWFNVDVEQVKLGKFPAPAFVADKVETLVAQWIQAYQSLDIICISEITITDNWMRLVGEVQ